MANDSVLGVQLPKWARMTGHRGLRLDSSSYIGIVKNNQDPTRSGRLAIWIPDFGGDQNDDRNWRTVRYASPMFGSTHQPESSKNNKFPEVNHTYGIWMVPPDIGNEVLCTFVKGDPERGFWFACINPTLSHYMVPGMAAGNKTDSTQTSTDVKRSILQDTEFPQSFPVAEFNENAPDAINSTFYNNPKPIHEYQASILFQQGLDSDNVRGANSSSSQRETPSAVFGISTPGRAYGNDPADDPDYLTKLQSGNIKEDDYAVRARKGGHIFVMDDGDVTGKDQVIRLRSAAGHQILMNDTERLMYVANSTGSVWIELNESGQMHIYTAGGFNVRSEGDINFHSDSTINIQAENDINLSAGRKFNVNALGINISAAETLLAYSGSSTQVGSGGTLIVGADGALTVTSSAAVNVNGATVDLNTQGAGNSIAGVTLKKRDFPDTSYNDPKKFPYLWRSVPNAASSIVTVMPAHEPWPRGKEAGGGPSGAGGSPSQPAPTKQVSSNECAPKTASAGNIAGITAAGKDNETILEQALATYGITDKNQFAQIMAQCKHESGKFQFLRELGADSYFTRQGHYEGRADLGNIFPGDGLLFKGRGYIQITGRDAYTKAGTYLKLDLVGTPSLAEEPANAAKLVLWFFFVNKKGFKNQYMPQAMGSTGFDWSNTSAVTGCVNGGQNGLSERQLYFQQYQEKYANGVPTVASNTAQPGQVATGSGGTLVDSSGNPVVSGSASLVDVGIKNAGGKSITNTCPVDKVSGLDAYTPPGAIGTVSPKLTQKHAKAMCAELGYFESQLDYTKVNSDSARVGKYQVDAAYLAMPDRLYIKPDSVAQFGDLALTKKESWTGKDGITSIDAFEQNRGIQDALQFKEFNDNAAALIANGGVTADDDICVMSGMLFVAHQLRSADKAKEWRNKGGVVDKYNIPSEDYFNHGRYAIDILAAQAAAGGAATSSAPNGANTSGINVDDVLQFTGTGTGTRAAFDATTSEFKTAILGAAKEYKDKTGSKILITAALRTSADQQQLYDRWVAAGGHMPDRPSAGGITTPAKPAVPLKSAHGLGFAIDANQAEIIAKTVDLAAHGLVWGGTWPGSKSDKPHIQMANFTKTNY